MNEKEIYSLVSSVAIVIAAIAGPVNEKEFHNQVPTVAIVIAVIAGPVK